MQSGCVFNPWAFNDNHREVALKLAEQLGCQKDDPKEIVQYLLNIPAIDLVKCTTLKVKYEVCTHFFQFSIFLIVFYKLSDSID